MFSSEINIIALDWLLEELFTAVEPIVIFGQLLHLLVQVLCLVVFSLQSCHLVANSNQGFKIGKAAGLNAPNLGYVYLP